MDTVSNIVTHHSDIGIRSVPDFVFISDDVVAEKGCGVYGVEEIFQNSTDDGVGTESVNGFELIVCDDLRIEANCPSDEVRVPDHGANGLVWSGKIRVFGHEDSEE